MEIGCACCQALEFVTTKKNIKKSRFNDVKQLPDNKPCAGISCIRTSKKHFITVLPNANLGNKVFFLLLYLQFKSTTVTLCKQQPQI